VKEKEAPKEGDRPKRDRKSVSKFQFETKKEDKETTIPKGKGVALGEHPTVTKNLSSVKSTEPYLKKLHRLLFGVTGKKHVIKKNIRLFSGYEIDDKDKLKSSLEEKLNKLEKGDLKDISKLLDQNYGGSKVDLVAGLIDFLLNPKPSKSSKKSVSKGSGKRKRSTKKGSKGKKEKREKRETTSKWLHPV